MLMSDIAVTAVDEPRTSPFVKEEMVDNGLPGKSSPTPDEASSPPVASGIASSPPTAALKKVSPEPIITTAAAVTSIPITISSSSSCSSPFSAAHLFGLLEASRGAGEQPHQQQKPQHKLDTMPTMHDGIDGHGIPSMTMAPLTASSVTNIFNNGTTAIPSSNAMSIAAVTPIDQLLQISQQIFGENLAKQQQQQQRHHQQQFNQIMNGGGGRKANSSSSRGGGAAENGGGNSSAGGGKHSNGEGGSDRKRSYPYTFQFCVLCQKNVHSSKLPCHIRQCHVGKPMFQCPVCDFTSTYSKNNVKSHMVSLHGMAGDPISYMDQYAAQVEDFMKKCFPNVRGRGRPVHGRFSPTKSQQQKVPPSPTTTVASGISSSDGASSTTSSGPTPADLLALTPPRRNSTTALAFLNGGSPVNVQQQQQTPVSHSQPRGRASHRAAAAANRNNNVGQLAIEEAAANGNGGGGRAPPTIGRPAASFGDQQANLYGTAMGMLMASTGNARDSVLSPPRLQNEQHHMLDNNNRMTLPNGFTTAFNPFLYLQQLNGLFPTPFHANFDFNNKNNVQDRSFKLDTEMKVENPPPEPTGKALLELEECLTLSQKFLREIGDDNANDGGGQQMEMDDDDGHGQQQNCHRQDGRASSCGATKDATSTLLTTCHSSSSTASPPSRACFQSSSSDLHAERPRYFPQSFAAEWSLLDGPGLEKTVFSTFSSSIELIEKFDLTVFESLLEQQNSGGSLLTPAQRARVSDVRHRLGLQSFEIRYAIHRLDPNVLKSEQVHLVEEIAPTKADIRRFALFEQSNSSAGTLNEDEKFVLELSKIERLEEKLAVLALLGEFDNQVAQINQRLQNFASAAKLLFNSAQFHTLLHLLLTYINLISGDFNGQNQLVKGFHPSRIGDMCSFRFPGGKTLLEVLANILRKDFTDLLAFVGNNGGIVGEAAKFEFAQILRALHSLEKGQSLVEEELQLAGDNARNQQLASFLVHCSVECAQLKEAVQSTKSQLLATMEYFGDICGGNEEGQEANNFQPERFFAVIAQFIGGLHTATSQ